MEKQDFIIVVVRGMTLASNIVLRLNKNTGETCRLGISPRPGKESETRWIKVKEDE